MDDVIIGLDPSLLGFAVCRHDGVVPRMRTFKEESRGSEWEQRVERYRRLAAKVAEEIGRSRHPIFIESYSFSSKVSHAHTAGELGCYIRLKLSQMFGQPMIEIPPKELKKFVTGNGNANKSQMVSATSLRLGRTVDDDNQADAYGLAWIGRCVMGLDEPSNADRRKIIEAIRKRHSMLFEVATS